MKMKWTDYVLSTTFHRRNFGFKEISWGLIMSISLYILSPSFLHLVTLGKWKRVTDDNKDKRRDKYTTGIYNNAYECFINSSLQALSSIDGLSTYLNECSIFLSKCKENNLQINLPLHESLIYMLSQLQRLLLTPETISNDSVVRTLEMLFGGKLSRLQNDAHEFTQLLLEKLKEENIYLLHNYTEVKEPTVPNFLFEGTVGEHYVCLRCKKTSEIKNQAFLMYELSLPEQYSAKLEDVINKNQNEIIEDYACLCCQVTAILNNENYLSKFNDNKKNKENEDIVRELKNLLPHLKINSDIPDKLYYFVKNYSKNGLTINNIKSTIVKKSLIQTCPQILLFHLSRSMFNGMVSTRNPCRLDFSETLQLLESTHNVKYELKAMVKHTGSHSQGHYQCYKHKPNLVQSKRQADSLEKTAYLNRSVTVTTVSPDSHNTITEVKHGMKFKTVKTTRQYPYWCISDSNVKECTRNSLINEGKYVYMLYYERSKKQ